MLQYPFINPVAFSIGPLSVHWYGLMYLIGFVAAWLLLNWRCRGGSCARPWTKENISDIIFYGALGVILGGRVGYILFYNFAEFLHSPLMIFKIWQGGMSFHGGLLGVIIAMLLYSRKIHCHLADLTDFMVPVVPIGLGAGRIGNFINGELWGRVTDVPWGMMYPQGGALPRHPSELYEFLLEGVLLFIILWWYSSKPRPRYAVSGLFLVGYGCFRFFVEFLREPDAQLGYLFGEWLTMGQLLCVPMILVGVGMMVYAYIFRHI
jgi:phosphatidylglycerol:prolipoprotein diacylglycerol transferase